MNTEGKEVALDALSGYFQESADWDRDEEIKTRARERLLRGLVVAISIVAICEAIALAALAPLKTVEPLVIRVDRATGMVDVISQLAGTQGEITEETQQAIDKYWLAEYVRHRERYLWQTREIDRHTIGILSSQEVQQQYAVETDPGRNAQAPILVYGSMAEVDIDLRSISILNAGEEREGHREVTALVRYTKITKRKGERDVPSYWAATITFAYLNSKRMKVEDRLKNPLGFQALRWRTDQQASEG